MKKKIGIIGDGNVGSALARGLKRAGYDVQATGKENVRETAAWGEIVILAVAAADDETARETVLTLARDIGFDAVDTGPLQNARWLETLGYLNIQLGYVVGLGTKTGFRYLH
jgi:predicted dinucleotide-binding enzyme